MDKQIREATEKGQFDNLPGAGEPLAGMSGPDDELWWVHKLMHREGLVQLPPSLQLRKNVEHAISRARAATSAASCSQMIEVINAQIYEAIRTPMSGPPHNLVPFDVEFEIVLWHKRNARPVTTAQADSRQSGTTSAEPKPPRPSVPVRLLRWFRRNCRSGPGHLPRGQLAEARSP